MPVRLIRLAVRLLVLVPTADIPRLVKAFRAYQPPPPDDDDQEEEATRAAGMVLVK
jgi:hypothetical protein